MTELQLESMMTHLVQSTCNSVIDCPKGTAKRFALSHKLARREPIVKLYAETPKGKAFMKWDSILQGLLSRCSQFSTCRDELVNQVNIPRPLVSARWRETNDRRVLAPLGLKQNTDNIIAGNVAMSRKRKADAASIWTPTKRAKLDNASKSSNVLVKRTSNKKLLLQHKCYSKRPFVKLFDVLKEIPREKEKEEPVHQNQFMGFLGLASKTSVITEQAPELKTNHSFKLVAHPHIPFSSDYGRRLLARERHCLPQEVALRKIERTEWYLKGAAAMPNSNYSQLETTCTKKAEGQHRYQFPRRQFCQNHQTLQQAFSRYLCKPLCVKLEIIDVTPFLTKLKAKGDEGQIVPSKDPTDEPKGDDVISISDSCSSDMILVECAVPSLSDKVSELVLGNGNKSSGIIPFKNRRSHLELVSNSDRRRSRRSLRLNNNNTL